MKNNLNELEGRMLTHTHLWLICEIC